ncbi:MAG: arsenosugar biosynthesis radical SAM protein ArsS [Clostridiales Family XIII bacterium]|jgi:radical SAM/Cys-rich protein|nr:arsenosugar biosynthesis radical SAM protein ArsS [Clostridiales Family XIII bacterium]
MANKYAERVKDFPSFADRAECRKFGAALPSPGTMQVNIGRRCNLACKHCHMDAGPDRAEVMRKDIMQACLEAFEKRDFKTLDITGGAPELNPDFPWLVREAARRRIHTIVRTNLTVLLESDFAAFPALYAENGVEIVASLPYYAEADTDRQRGKGVFSASISALRRLNDLGYGTKPKLALRLVYNPGGAFLPANQESLAAEFRKKLAASHNIAFNNLYAITNSPIGRFGDFLDRSGNLTGYMNRLIAAFNPAAVENMMCRNQISVDWDGSLYDCDFNIALGLKAAVPGRIRDFPAFGGRGIVFGNHCYACTAGAGSSCGGATA